MSSATPELRADWRRPSMRQRALVIGLTLIAELLFLLMLLGLGPASWGDKSKRGAPTDIIFLPQPEEAAPSAAAPAEAQAANRAPPTPRPRPKLPPAISPKPPWVELTSEQFAAADISKLGSAGGKAKGSGGASSAQVGVGPGGATLYKAEWYREPTDAELGGYLPKRSIEPGSWAEVACKTIADNRVENCQALGESPPGSGLARAIRLAGWQFRIRPPRIDGKPQVGTWVMVHIEFTPRDN